MNAEPNPRAGIGGNYPPQTPFDTVKSRIDDLVSEADRLLSQGPIVSQAIADRISDIVASARQAWKEADDLRKAEGEPFDEAKKAVQEKYAPLIADTQKIKGKVPMLLSTCKLALNPWLKKLDQEKAEVAARARREAEESARVAAEAARTAEKAGIAEKAEAEKLLMSATKAEATARSAENVRAHAGGAVGRAVHLHTTYRAEITDMSVFAKYLWLSQRNEVEAVFHDLARKLVNKGLRSLPGVVVHEEKAVR